MCQKHHLFFVLNKFKLVPHENLHYLKLTLPWKIHHLKMFFPFGQRWVSSQRHVSLPLGMGYFFVATHLVSDIFRFPEMLQKRTRVLSSTLQLEGFFSSPRSRRFRRIRKKVIPYTKHVNKSWWVTSKKRPKWKQKNL